MKRNLKTRRLHAIKTLWILGRKWCVPEQVSPRFRESDEELMQLPNLGIRRRLRRESGIYYPTKLGYSEAVSLIADKFFDSRTENGTRYDCIVFNKAERDEITSWQTGRPLVDVRREYREAKQCVDDWKSQVDDWYIQQETKRELVAVEPVNDDEWEGLYCYEGYQSIIYDDDYDSRQWKLQCIDSVWSEHEEMKAVIDDYWCGDNSEHLFPDNEWTSEPTSIPDSPFSLI